MAQPSATEYFLNNFTLRGTIGSKLRRLIDSAGSIAKGGVDHYCTHCFLAEFRREYASDNGLPFSRVAVVQVLLNNICHSFANYHASVFMQVEDVIDQLIGLAREWKLEGS